jgi:hypothetical protein
VGETVLRKAGKGLLREECDGSPRVVRAWRSGARDFSRMVQIFPAGDPDERVNVVATGRPAGVQSKTRAFERLRRIMRPMLRDPHRIRLAPSLLSRRPSSERKEFDVAHRSDFGADDVTQKHRSHGPNENVQPAASGRAMCVSSQHFETDESRVLTRAGHAIIDPTENRPPAYLGHPPAARVPSGRDVQEA